MDIGLTKKVENLKNEVRYFIDNEIRPKEDEYFLDVGVAGSRFEFTQNMLNIINNLKKKAIRKNLWNFWLNDSNEGHGLTTVEYAYLAEEMGIYETPYEHFGKLTYEMWRACRLVVDTGIHEFGWSRDQAVNFMKSNTALSIHEINTEIDRYISWPGQALAYKIGELKIRSLRNKVEEKLGQNFDIREFHELILEKGTVTLSILERRINQYLEKKVHE